MIIALLGEVRSHIQLFKNSRNKWVEHFVMETNKTVIRLEKLLYNLPQDTNKRKGMYLLDNRLYYKPFNFVIYSLYHSS